MFREECVGETGLDGSLRIAVDYRPAHGQRSGIGRYVYEILKRVHRCGGADLYLVSEHPFRPVQRVGHSEDLERHRPYLWVPFPLKKMVRLGYTEPKCRASLEEMSLYWGTNYFLPSLEKVPWKQVLTVHDLAWQYYPETIKASMLARLRDLRRHIELADKLLTVSEATKADLIKSFEVDPSKISVVYNGVSDWFHPVQDGLQEVRTRHRLPRRFFLFVGTVEPRKNLVRLIEAFDLVAKELEQSLVIVGGMGWRATPIYKAVKRSPARDRIHFLGFVPDADLSAIYNLADAFIYPSLYEGFGIPVVEAMACGVPVVTSDCSSLPEIAKGAALLVDPFDVPRLADAMQRIVQDEQLRATLRVAGFERAKRFSWDASASAVMTCFNELCGRPSTPAVAR